MADLHIEQVESCTKSGKWWIEARVIGFVEFDEMNDFPKKLEESIIRFCKNTGAHINQEKLIEKEVDIIRLSKQTLDDYRIMDRTVDPLKKSNITFKSGEILVRPRWFETDATMPLGYIKIMANSSFDCETLAVEKPV